MDIQEQLDSSLDDVAASKGARSSSARSGGPRRQRGPTRRSQPYKKTGPKRTYRSESPVAAAASGSDRRNLKVSGTSIPKVVAGSIAHICRAGSAPSIMATGDIAINQAVKSIAVARRYLEEEGDVDIKVQPRFKARSKMLTLSVEKTRKSRDLSEEFLLDTDMIVKASTDGSKTAGAIAARAREGTPCAVVSNGNAGVFQTIRSIAIARQYLTDDHKDLYFVPAMVDTERSDGSKSVMLRCRVLVHDI